MHSKRAASVSCISLRLQSSSTRRSRRRSITCCVADRKRCAPRRNSCVAWPDSAIAKRSAEETARLLARLRVSPEGREGLSAFLERRKPGWHAAASSRTLCANIPRSFEVRHAAGEEARRHHRRRSRHRPRHGARLRAEALRSRPARPQPGRSRPHARAVRGRVGPLPHLSLQRHARRRSVEHARRRRRATSAGST